MKIVTIIIAALILCTMPVAFAGPSQATNAYVDTWPELENPTALRNWQTTATQYNDLIFGKSVSGKYLPIIGLKTINEPTASGFIGQTFGMPSYLGRPGWKYGDNGEGLSCLGAVLSASLSGNDMTKAYNNDWVKMCEYFYTEVPVNNGAKRGYVSNDAAGSNSTGSWWYDLAPASLFFQIGMIYDKPSYNQAMRATADTLADAAKIFNNNWRHAGFDLKTWKVNDLEWIEPDAAIGIAYIEYLAYNKFHDKKYLDVTKSCMNQIQNYFANPYYELLGSYGPYTAARLNAVNGGNYDVGKFLGFILTDSSDSRPGWGVMNDKWGNYPAYGLCGSTTDSDGYAFAMNTFANAGAVAPVARYAPEYSRVIGKWLTNVAYNSNIFYADGLPAQMQEEYNWSKDTGVTCLAYEGTRNKGKTQPFGTGDFEHYFSMYSSWGGGIMAALFQPTNVNGIVSIDLLKTDVLKANAYPTYLYYNPYSAPQTVSYNVGARPTDVYCAVQKKFIARSVTGANTVTIPPHSAVQLVYTPVGKRVVTQGDKLLINGVVVDYNYKGKLKRQAAAIQETFSDWPGFTNIGNWVNAANANVQKQPVGMRFNNIIDTWGLMEQTVTIDLAKTPKLSINVTTVSTNAKWAMKVDDGKTSYYLQSDNSRTGKFNYDIHARTAWTGSKTFKIQVFPLGGPGCYLDIEYMRFGN